MVDRLLIRAALAAAVALATGGCLRTTTFHCTDDSTCGNGGTCQPNGLCSFADPSCSSGERFGQLSGGDANQCVGSDNTMPDANPIDSPPPCSGYTSLAGISAHVYLQESGTGNWDDAKASCPNGGTLAAPASSDELAAILAVTQSDTWIGVQAMGANFVTVTGDTESFLPWAAGQPDGAMGKQCVLALDSSAEYELEKCQFGDHAAMCQCDP